MENQTKKTTVITEAVITETVTPEDASNFPKNKVNKTMSCQRRKKSTKPMTISDQIEAFLNAGGEIQKIPSGVSGQPSIAYRRSMTISEKATEKIEL